MHPLKKWKNLRKFRKPINNAISVKHREENDFESINHRLFSFMRMRDISKLTISLIVMLSVVDIYIFELRGLNS